MNTYLLLAYIFAMALTTYVIRMIPLAFIKRKIKSNFIKSFLYYLPYTVLGAMTVPAVLYSTSSIFSACIGIIVATIFAWKGKNLLIVALAGCATVFVVEMAMRYMGLLYS